MVAKNIYAGLKDVKVYPKRTYFSESDLGKHVAKIVQVTKGQNWKGEEFFGVDLELADGSSRSWLSKPKGYQNYHLVAVKSFLLAATGLDDISDADLAEAVAEGNPLAGRTVRIKVYHGKPKRDGGFFIEVSFAPAE